MLGKGWPENPGRFRPAKRNFIKRPVKIDESVTEHVVPRSRGGPDNWDNIALSCIECDKRKGSHTGLEFMYLNNKRLG
jgi:5-methylcytosine-specific restriction endonuclease McrA